MCRIGKIMFLSCFFNYSFEREGCQLHLHGGNCLARSLLIMSVCILRSFPIPWPCGRHRSPAGTLYPQVGQCSSPKSGEVNRPSTWTHGAPASLHWKPHQRKCHAISPALAPWAPIPVSIMVINLIDGELCESPMALSSVVCKGVSSGNS